MIILAIDTAETTACAGISDGDKLIGQSSLKAGLTHSETLMPMIEQLMKSAHLSYDDIDIFACTAGPGSFTGVRIGVSTVKGLAFGKSKPCIGLSATEALAYNFVAFNGIICPSMDARRNQLYNALFECRDGKITRLCGDRMISKDELAKELEEDFSGKPIYICGGGSDILIEATKGNPNIKKTPELLKYQNGFSCALCAYNSFLENRNIYSDISLSPIYLRPSQAERMKNEKESANK